MSRNIHDLFENISVPQVITDEAMKAYHRLGEARRIAVRSIMRPRKTCLKLPLPANRKRF